MAREWLFVPTAPPSSRTRRHLQSSKTIRRRRLSLDDDDDYVDVVDDGCNDSNKAVANKPSRLYYSDEYTATAHPIERCDNTGRALCELVVRASSTLNRKAAKRKVQLRTRRGAFNSYRLRSEEEDITLRRFQSLNVDDSTYE